jgi:hypothetical protein
VWAQKLARAVSYRLKRSGACDRSTCFPRAGRGGGEPAAAPGHSRVRRTTGLGPGDTACVGERAGAQRPWPCPCAVAWPPAAAPVHMARGARGTCALPLPRTGASLAPREGQPGVCGEREAGTDMLRGRTPPGMGCVQSPSRGRETRTQCVGQPPRRTSRRQ